MKSRYGLLFPVCAALMLSSAPPLAAADPWVTYDPPADKSNGKTVVLLSGDEEYRSEESMPMLGKLLSQKHGFKCIVLFSQDADGTINPNNQTNVPGMHFIDNADLVVNAFRFRELPDADMKHFMDYVDSGRPMVVIRTGTHAFNYTRNTSSPYANMSFGAKGGGFGGMTVGETWTSHYGDHARESCRGLIDGRYLKNPILKSVRDVWGPTDVYGVNADFPADAMVLIWGQTLKGMKPEDAPNLNKSIMPLAWLREYRGPSGKTAKVLCSTVGAAIDLKSEDLRRFFVNATLHLTGQAVPDKADVEPVGTFEPTMFGFNGYKKGVKVSEHVLR